MEAVTSGGASLTLPRLFLSVASIGKNPGRRLGAFALGLLLFTGCFELFVRRNEALFASASHRALAKAAMCDRQTKVDFLFFGTSRTQDGVSPRLISEELAEITPEKGDIQGYNAAFTSSSLDALEALADRFLARPELQLVVVELSDPQCVNPATPWNSTESNQEKSGSVEGRLSRFAKKLHFIRYRSAFLSDNIARLPALLLFAPALGGWEVKGADQLASWLGRREKPASDFDHHLWTPSVVSPAVPVTMLDAHDDAIAKRFVAIAAKYRAKGIKVVFASPPLSQQWEFAPERDRMKALFAEVARQSGCEVWDFSSLNLDTRFFRNPSHIGNEGRAHYSKSLAHQMARVMATR